MKCVVSTLAILVPTLALVSSARAAVVELAPTKDNTLIQQSNPSMQLSNGRGDIYVGRTGQPEGVSTRRGLIAFDLAGAIPSGATITSATLTLRDAVGQNGDRVITAHRVLSDWGEGDSYFNGGRGAEAADGDATWLYASYNAADPTSSIAWETPGGDFEAAASASALLPDDGGGQFYSWSGAGMAADVQAWLDNPAENFGWLLMGDESERCTAKRLNGSTLNNPMDVAPVLTVSYVPEPSAIGLAAALSIATIAGRRLPTLRARLS